MTPEPEPNAAPGNAAAAGGRVLRRPHGEGREALIRAVVRVVARRGLSGLSYRAVAQEAGVTHGLVHYHFGSRDNMLVETMGWVVEHAVTTLGLLPDPAEDAGTDPLGNFVAAFGRLSEEDREAHLFANELILAACRQRELHEVSEPIYDYVFDSVGQMLVSAGIEPTPERVRLVFAAINGLTIQHLFFGSEEGSRAAAEELRALLEPLRSAASAPR